MALYVNGVRYAQVSEFHFTSDTPRRALHGIDSTEPYELAPTTSRITGSMTVYRLSGDGGSEGAGMTAPTTELSREKYVSFMLVEHHTDLVVFETRNAVVTSQSWSFAAKQQVVGRIQWEAIDFSNEVRLLGH